jgi:hypothetical protein
MLTVHTVHIIRQNLFSIQKLVYGDNYTSHYVWTEWNLSALCNQKLYHSILKYRPLIHNLSQMNPLNIPTILLFNIHFNTIFLSTTIS